MCIYKHFIVSHTYFNGLLMPFVEHPDEINVVQLENF
jgi:hypothetical protein